VTATVGRTEARDRVELVIGGMSCAACAVRVERRLNKLEGVTASVNFATERATVETEKPTSYDTLLAAVAAAGCTTTRPPAHKAQETPDAGPKASEAGPKAADAEPKAAGSKGESKKAAPDPSSSLRVRLWFCLVLSLPVVVLAMVPAFQFIEWQWWSLLLTTPVVLWGGWPLHRAALTDLRHGATTMNTLVSAGTLTAFGWSVYALFFTPAGLPGLVHEFSWTLPRGHDTPNLYFEAAAAVTTAVLAGRLIEARSKRRASDALNGLRELAPREAAIPDGDGERLVPIEKLAVGDLFVARPGEQIATDGRVVDGSSAVDTALMTGEPIPREVGPGDAVDGGAINVGGRIIVKATRVGADTRLSQIVRLVEEAQTEKAPVQLLVDRLSGVFVPLVLGLAIVTVGFWLGTGGAVTTAVAAGVAVLVVACPCALGLATPLALLVGVGRGAQLGLLITGPRVLEAARRCDTVLLDKTGTLTTGLMTVTDIVAADGEEASAVLGIAAAAEEGSTHPIARAIVGAAERSLGPVKRLEKSGAQSRPAEAVVTVKDVAGRGVEATVAGVSVVVGTPALLAGQGFVIDGRMAEAVAEAESAARTAVLLGWGGRARGVIVLADTLRPGSASAVSRLRTLGLTPMLVTGDNGCAASAVAKRVGIDEVVAGALPEQKVELVRRLQREGKVVAMVGDGVNDAAALAQADVGMAMGAGSDIAARAGDLTLVRDDPQAAADAIRLARRTVRTIRGNLFWALAYNLAALPLAAAGRLNPMEAGVAMAASSVFVATNSLRLRRFE
jgi:Cu+-exporting ATPase